MGVRWTQEELDSKIKKGAVELKHDTLLLFPATGEKLKKKKTAKSFVKEYDLRPFYQSYILREWVIYGNVPSSKNHREIAYSFKQKRKVVVHGKACEKYKRNTLLKYKEVGIQLKEAIAEHGLGFPLALGFYFVRKTNQPFDLINAAQFPQDLLQEIGGLPNDDASHLFPVFLGWHKQDVEASLHLYLLNPHPLLTP